jgi:membrane associated rhomboid family serine protease
MSFFRQFKPARHTQMPPGVLNLIIINVIMFAAMQFGRTSGIEMNLLLGLHHPFTYDFSWYQYLTSMFMHGNLMHLAFNMIGLWLFGHLLENAFGTRRFLIFYLICGLGASFIYQVWESIAQYRAIVQQGVDLGFFKTLQAYPPFGYMVGASGAVYGLLMGAALLFPNTTLPYMGFMGMPMKIKWLAVIYGGAEIFRSWKQNPGDNVAHFAHIGGMIFGFILVKIFARSRTNFY